MKKFLCLCAVMLITFSLRIGVSAKEEGKTLKINNEAQLASFLNGEFSAQYDTFILCKDIILTEKTGKCEFSGLLDGKGFSIVLENGSTGLFSKINEGARIRNLSIAGSVGEREKKSNGICEQNNGTVENCIITALFSGTSEINGICSVNNGKIINCAVLGKPKPGESEIAAWHSATLFNNGEIERFYYINDYVKSLENYGIALNNEQCQNGELLLMLNAYVKDNPLLLNWSGENGAYPRLDTVSEDSASVFASNQTILVACFIASFIILLVFIICYADKRFMPEKS